MPKLSLSETFLRSLPNPTKRTEFIDADSAGLMLRAEPSGKRVWSVRYSPLGSAAKKRYPLGDYPTVTLTEARKRAAAIRDRSRSGADPAAEREAVREKRQKEEKTPALDFNGLCDLYLPELAKRKSSWDQDRGYLGRDARPQWGARRPDQITKTDCAKRLLEVAQRAPVAANRLRAALLSVFGWAVDQGLLEHSPMVGIKKPTRERKEGVDRTLTDAEFIVLWRAIEAARLAPGLRAALQVLALTGQRPNEIAGLQISDLRHLDAPAEALAEMPAAKMKGRRKHVWPISAPVAEIIRQQIARQVETARIEGRPVSDHIFASRFMDRERIARHSMSQALRRIIPALDASGEDGDIVRRLQADPPTPHAFRRTCVSGMARLGIPREDRKAVVAHAEDDVLGSHYDAYDRLREKRIALEAWGRNVEALLTGVKSHGAVIPLRRA